MENLPSYVITAVDDSTPFRVVSIAEYEIKLFWTKRAGIHGFQVISLLSKDYSLIDWNRTGGCGYSKENHALAGMLKLAGVMPDGFKLGSESISHSYHIGGNFYRVPDDDVITVLNKHRS